MSLLTDQEILIGGKMNMEKINGQLTMDVWINQITNVYVG